MRIAIVDTYYPAFLKTPNLDPDSDYEQQLGFVLGRSFGTFDAYSRTLRAIGHEVIDVIANHRQLQEMWAREHNSQSQNLELVALEQIKDFRPDVVFMQDLSFFSLETLKGLADRYLLAGQCSCAMPDVAKLRQFHVLFTSFPHYVPRFESMGVRAIYLPLAFDPIVLERCGENLPKRSMDCVFVGGAGSNWRAGTSLLEGIAANIPGFMWFGYGAEQLPRNSALRKAYRGEAWGIHMYRILQEAKIVINRHAEYAEGYANNLRMYEATGCGAMLLTDNRTAHFAGDEIVTYATPADAVDKIRHYLRQDVERERIAERGQIRTMAEHTYKERMPVSAAELANAMKETTGHIPA
jgi:spore maturation protein CgeB